MIPNLRGCFEFLTMRFDMLICHKSTHKERPLLVHILVGPVWLLSMTGGPQQAYDGPRL